MKMQVAKYLSLASIMATVAWFFWNPAGWSFEWEPVVVFLASLGAFVGFDWKDHSGARKTEEQAGAHPSDIFLFKQLIELLPSSGVIHFLKTHDFLGSFKRDEINPIEEFLYEWGNAEHEFQDKDVEELKGELYVAARKFNTLVGKYTSPNKYGFQAVRPDHYEGGHQRELEFQREAEEIGDAADEVVAKHQEFVRAGRQKFGDGTI
jgi:hypothetical protein